jgi:outer membrane protein TolC
MLGALGGLLCTLCAAQQTAPPPAAISLEEAIKRAQSANTAFAAAISETRIAQSEHTITRSLLLPNVVYHNQYLYTQGTGQPATAPVKFIANNAVHEYVSQGSVTETIGGIGIAEYKLNAAAAAAAHARFEVARRGLVVTVVANYYGVFDADAKLAAAQRALDEANHFSTITAKRESNGEVAHADTVRADLQVQQRQRELNDAGVVADRARLDLGVMLFNDPSITYTLTTSFDEFPTLPSRPEIEAAAMANNPELKAAMESLRAAQHAVTASKFAYFPDLVLNYSYGIDAPQFAVKAPDGTRNLGYSASLKEAYQEAQVSLDQLRLLDKSVQSATESLRLTTLRYSSGEGNILEVVDSQNTLVLAETGRADGAARYFNALANLQTLTGSMPR